MKIMILLLFSMKQFTMKSGEIKRAIKIYKQIKHTHTERERLELKNHHHRHQYWAELCMRKTIARFFSLHFFLMRTLNWDRVLIIVYTAPCRSVPSNELVEIFLFLFHFHFLFFSRQFMNISNWCIIDWIILRTIIKRREKRDVQQHIISLHMIVHHYYKWYNWCVYTVDGWCPFSCVSAASKW